MSASKEIKQIQATVLDLLTKEPKYRDSNKMLSARIWSIQIGGYDTLKKTTAYDFLAEYVKGKSKLYSQESIGRASRKIQENNPELRGKKYKERLEEQAEVIAVILPNGLTP